MASLGAVRREVKRLYRELGNWRAVGAALGISGGMAYRIGVHGYKPRDAQIRSRLGLVRGWRDLWEADVDVLREALERRQEWR